MSDDKLELKIFTNPERMRSLEEKLRIAVDKAEDGHQSVAASALFQSLQEIVDLLADTKDLFNAWYRLKMLQEISQDSEEEAIELEDDEETGDEAVPA